MGARRGTHEKKQSRHDPSAVFPSYKSYQQTEVVVQSGKRTGAVENERIVRRVPHVAEDSAEHGPTRVKNFRV